tara:strand:- start:6038 stop:6208 length:171 start_codon:yes stop_codon:yes gene_type:complete
MTKKPFYDFTKPSINDLMNRLEALENETTERIEILEKENAQLRQVIAGRKAQITIH